MSISNFLLSLATKLSEKTKVLTDVDTEEFKVAIEQWSDLDRKIPAAIIVAGTEQDVATAVKYAVDSRIPFVPKSGGHSAWSTIGSEGIIIDLSSLTNITIDEPGETVTIQSGVLNQQLIEALNNAQLCLPLGGGNTIGSVPQALGGGICALSKICGTTSDNIVSASLITASGELITVDDTRPDLFWALKGAGQHFGLVTELTLKAYPISTLGTDDGTVWIGTSIFDISKVDAVARLCDGYMDDTEHNTANLCVITLAPSLGAPCMLLMSTYFGPAAEAEEYYAPFKALNPMMSMGSMIKYSHINDGIDPFCTKGGFKKFTLNGLPRFNPAPWQGIADNFIELVKKCPDVVSGGYGFEWVSGVQKKIDLDSAWAHRDVKCWVESLQWYTNPDSRDTVEKATDEALKAATKGFQDEEIHTYQNFSRYTSLESRFGSKDRVEKLRLLKRKWDPTGVFTKEFL